jgi:hypothetical protein
LKALAAILFAFFVVWQPATAKPEKVKCCGIPQVTCVSACCCVQRAPVSEPRPVAPLQTRSIATEQINLQLPTVSAVVLEETNSAPFPSHPAFRKAAGAIPLFRRDCAILI